MKILVIRSPYLIYSQETINGYRALDSDYRVKFLSRSRDVGDIVGLQSVVRRGNYDVVLDLGCSCGDHLDLTAPYFNSRSTNAAVTTPGALRSTMDEALPPWPTPGDPAWLKQPGEGGSGKTFYESYPGGGVVGWSITTFNDWQRHIEGDEYRVNTVGDRVVQAHRKGDLDTSSGRNKFEYDWVGLDGIRTNGVIPLIKSAVVNIPRWHYTVLGWDIIVSETGAYVIEVNTSPGMNVATAQRIYAEIERRL